MNHNKNKRAAALILTISILLQSASLLVLDNSANMRIPPVSVASLDDTWRSVQPLTIADDDQSSFWTIEHSGVNGSIAATTTEDYVNKKTGSDSLKIVSSNGIYTHFDVYHKYEGSINLYMFSVFVLWWCGDGTNATFRLNLYTPDEENKLYFDFFDDFSGWRQFVLYFDKNFTSVRNVNLSLLKEIHISLETPNVQGTWCLDDVVADVLSTPTPETYLDEYEWALNTLLEHRDEKSSQVLASWAASNDLRNYTDTLRFDITLPAFTEAYKITGNKTYLTAAKESFDSAIKYLYNSNTHLFSTQWNSTSETYVDKLDIIWGAVVLNSMFDFYSVSLNQTYLACANDFAQALYTNGVNQTTNLPHRAISVSSGQVMDSNAYIPIEIGRLIGAYIKGYSVTFDEDFKAWAKNLTQAFWTKRNTTTNLVPLCINSNGETVFNFWEPNFDPILNVLLYAYEITMDDFYLSLATNLTDAELTYAWSKELNRTVRSVWTNGTVRSSILDLIDGPQMYIIGLLQLSKHTSKNKYLAYAEKMWNTIHNNALVNHLYATILDDSNSPNDISCMYTQQMMVQCDAYLFYFTKNETYLDDLKDAVNNFLLHYKMPYGFCHSTNTTNYETILDSTFDWLDSTSYTLGAAIYACSVYSMQNANVEADITYYVPYYPMFKIRGPLNYSNNQICFKLKGTSPCLDVSFTLPRGKTIGSIAVNGSSIFLYAEGVSQLLIWDPGSYSVNLTMTNGNLKDVLIEEVKFVNSTLKATLAAANAVNVTVKLHIPFNETSQTPFPKDSWDVNCTEIHWENIWDSVNRILTVWMLCNYSITITIENLPPEAVEGYIDNEEVTENSAKLEWKEATVRDFATYVICLSTDGNNWTQICSITEKSNTTYRVTELTPDTTYHFIIRTVDTAGLYKDSQQITCKTKPSTCASEFWWLLPLIVLAVLIIILTSVFLLKNIEWRAKCHALTKRLKLKNI